MGFRLMGSFTTEISLGDGFVRMQQIDCTGDENEALLMWRNDSLEERLALAP